jgi:hypothetical protein
MQAYQKANDHFIVMARKTLRLLEQLQTAVWFRCHQRSVSCGQQSPLEKTKAAQGRNIPVVVPSRFAAKLLILSLTDFHRPDAVTSAAASTSL